jgi:hypothetical protein
MKEKFGGFCFFSFVSSVFPIPQTRKLFHVITGHKQEGNKRYLPVSRQLTEDVGIFWDAVCVPLFMCLIIYLRK